MVPWDERKAVKSRDKYSWAMSQTRILIARLVWDVMQATARFTAGLTSSVTMKCGFGVKSCVRIDGGTFWERLLNRRPVRADVFFL